MLWHMFSLWKTAFIDWGKQVALGELTIIIGYGRPSQTTDLNRKGERRLPCLQFDKPNCSQYFDAQTIAQNNPILVFWFIFQLCFTTGIKLC